MPDKISCKNCARRAVCKVADSMLTELSMATMTINDFSILDAREAAAQVHFIMDRIAQEAGDKADSAGFGPEPPEQIMDLLRALKMVAGRRGRRGEGAVVTLTEADMVEEVPSDETIH